MDPTTAATSEIAGALNTYGVSAVAAILIVGIVLLFRFFMNRDKEKDAAFSKVIEGRHQQFIDILQKSVAAVERSSTVIEKNSQSSEEVSRLLEKTNETCRQCTDATTQLNTMMVELRTLLNKGRRDG